MKIIRDLTSKQTAILRFLQNKISQEGRPPTIREIGKQFGFKSTGTTRDYLSGLARKGYIRLTARQSRSIELVKPLAFRIPILGSVTAGLPDLAFQEIEEYLHLNEFLPSADQEIFALKVKGDSLIKKGIQDGDIAIIRRQRTATVGNIIAALIENETTIKILKKEKSKFFLAPANPSYPEIRKSFSILGKVIAVLKKF